MKENGFNSSSRRDQENSFIIIKNLFPNCNCIIGYCNSTQNAKNINDLYTEFHDNEFWYYLSGDINFKNNIINIIHNYEIEKIILQYLKI